MNLHEHQSKRIFAQHGSPSPRAKCHHPRPRRGRSPPGWADLSSSRARFWWGGRGKAGGIKLAKTPDEAEARACDILGMDIKGLTVKRAGGRGGRHRHRNSIWVRCWTGDAGVVLMASSEGGVEIEQVAAETPEKIITVGCPSLPAWYGSTHQARLPGRRHQPPPQRTPKTIKIASGLYNVHGERRQPGRDQPAGHHRRQPGDCGGRQDQRGRQRFFRHPDIAASVATWTRRTNPRWRRANTG
ncbi:MAG: ATP-grasp domain-containing protein [Caldilineaceae bacterium]